MALVTHLGNASTLTMSKRRGRPQKNENIAKGKEKAVVHRTKRKLATERNDRDYIPSKKVKMEPRANTCRKVDGDTLALTQPMADIVDLTSDDEEEMTGISHLRESTKLSNVVKAATKPFFFRTIAQQVDWQLPKKDPTKIESDLVPTASNNFSQENRYMAEELQKVQQQLQVTQNTIKKQFHEA
jgi:hypothetical protein